MFARYLLLTTHCSLLLSWVLLVPPSGAPHNISFADKLRMWTEAAEADTQAECEDQREQMKIAAAMGRAADAVERSSRASALSGRKWRRGEGSFELTVSLASLSPVFKAC